MIRLSERLDRMSARAASPDGNILGELTHRTQLTLSFRGDSYDRYHSDSDLASQLTGLARLLWAAREREYFAVISDLSGEAVSSEPVALGRRDREYREARDEIVAEGRSADGRVRVQVRGMRQWSVHCAQGTVRALTQEQFCAAAAQATTQLIDDQTSKIRQLKDKVYEGEAW